MQWHRYADALETGPWVTGAWARRSIWALLSIQAVLKTAFFSIKFATNVSLRPSSRGLQS